MGNNRFVTCDQINHFTKRIFKTSSHYFLANTTTFQNFTPEAIFLALQLFLQNTAIQLS